MLATSPYGASSNIALWRAISKPPVELVVADLDVVNTALHGWKMIDAEHYFTRVKDKHINIYLAEIDGVVVSTCATIQNGNTASLEFVSTLEQYRRKKAAALLSSYAIDALLNNGAETITLGACGHGVHLYRGLGFKQYFSNIILKYDCAE